MVDQFSALGGDGAANSVAADNRDAGSGLLDPAFSKQLAAIVFSDSHGAFDDHLGAGAVYYALAAMVRSQVSVCIGSGGGFVPRLLRQAQRDLSLSNAETYLVDANLPDLGFGHPMQAGGWLTPENDLQTAWPGLTILRMLSSDAARLFAAAGITIDYLHIDGDHSARGVVADVVDYLPLLSRRAVVSLHDLRMPSVRQAMTEIARDHPNLEWITFNEIGNGTAILRRRTSELTAPLPLSRDAMEDAGRPTRLDAALALREAERSQAKARYERWHYLTTPAYQSRYAIVAQHIDLPGRTIIEIGGFPNSVIRHLRSARRVIAIEPYAPPDYLDEVHAAAKKAGIELLVRHGTLGKIEFHADLVQPYALMALGLDVSAGCDTREEFRAALESLVELAVGAEIVAIETPGYPPSQVARECLLACIEPHIVQDIALDLSQDPAADEYFVKDERAKRRILVFRPGLALSESRRKPLLARNAAAFPDFGPRLLLKSKTYELGTSIEFRRGSGAEGFLSGGWSGLEPRHVWAIGRSSTIGLDISGLANRTQPLELRLDLIAFVRSGKLPHQRLAVIVNGKRVFKGKITTEGVLDIPIDREVVLRRNPARIALIHPDGAKPRELVPTSTDGRVLSIGLRSLALVSRAVARD